MLDLGDYIKIIIVLLVLGFGIFWVFNPLFTQTDVNITVADKERIVDRSGKSSRYLIWSEEGETFENTDYMLLGKFNSSDLYGSLRKEHSYRCHVAGLRITFLSSYRNLIRCEERGE